ncbi:pimeloyl-ACP methyl ester esterase BioH [Thalassomonas sp. M1454]|uniref:pimeloyl-ACP methyl ester esterase BioH n=1 Tax=Thalassomonas sp. M1454 TaxID=2594477 RepID=UPI00117EB8BE|nr:pimeloyl-ACP methyl ester esterase BioH [Thalassomonas sp. M1454]TRX55128.1 pimeloyl-ACP methyl ester esterase BioH [Thalassomonas sp. M1454]
MQQPLNIQIKGQGTPIVLIHGWGLNSAIFQPLSERLAQDYQVIMIDMPGFGVNSHITTDDYSLANVSQMIAAVIPDKSLIIGWSLGGLIATNIALHHQDKALGLVTITSSPYFVKEQNWPGINPEILKDFHSQLKLNAEKTINSFLKIQAMGSESIRQDVKAIKALINQHPNPSPQTLDDSLTLLETVDLRSKVNALSIPVFRLYGRLDSLVPKAVVRQADKLFISTDSYTFERASHAPFISHADEFYTVLCDWITGKIINK